MNPMMSLMRASVIAIVIVIVAALMSSKVEACSMPVGWRPRSAVEKLLDAREVLFATVLRTFPDRPRVYTAEVAVHCILKGHQSDSIVNITHAGHEPGWCHTTNLEVGHRYLILVTLHDGVYSTASAELPAETDEQLANFTVACGLQSTYPKGVDARKATVKCPTPAPPGKCKSKQDFEPSVTNSLPSKNDDDDDLYSNYDEQKPHAGRAMDGRNAGHTWHRLPAAVTLCFILLTRWSVNIATSST